MEMGDRIKERRLAMGYTQEELATKLGLQKSAIAKYENGRVENIKRSTIANMSRILECRASYLMGWDDDPTKETTLTTDESHLMDAYRTLNPTGKREAVKRVDELTYIPSYSIKWSDTTLAAAHEADDATDETRKHDDDIMMDDSEWE